MPDNKYEDKAAEKEVYAKENGKVGVKEDGGSYPNQGIFKLSSNIQNQEAKNTGHSYLSKASFHLYKG